MDAGEFFEPEYMYLSWLGVFVLRIVLVLFRVNRCIFSPSVFLQVLLTLFLCCLFIRFFSYVVLVAIFCSKIVLFPLHPVVGKTLCHLPLLVGRIFSRYFGISWLVCIVLPCLDIFLIFLHSPVISGLFFRVVLSFLHVLRFPFCPNMFQRFSFVLSFLLVVDFLSAFPVEFPIKVLSFCLCFFSQTNFAPA